MVVVNTCQRWPDLGRIASHLISYRPFCSLCSPRVDFPIGICSVSSTPHRAHFAHAIFLACGSSHQGSSGRLKNVHLSRASCLNRTRCCLNRIFHTTLHLFQIIHTFHLPFYHLTVTPPHHRIHGQQGFLVVWSYEVRIHPARTRGLNTSPAKDRALREESGLTERELCSDLCRSTPRRTHVFSAFPCIAHSQWHEFRFSPKQISVQILFSEFRQDGDRTQQFERAIEKNLGTPSTLRNGTFTPSIWLISVSHTKDTTYAFS